jgi:hypothetical protein
MAAENKVLFSAGTLGRRKLVGPSKVGCFLVVRVDLVHLMPRTGQPLGPGGSGARFLAAASFHKRT